MGDIAVHEEVTEEEKRLADSLRTLCTPWGTEQESTLSRSASIILDLGKLYASYAKLRTGMLQKLTFIKAAALICGARTRFEKMQREKQLEEAQLCFRHMTSTLLSACNASVHKDLLALSDKASAYLLDAREEEKRFISDKLGLLDHRISGSELRDRQRRKVESIRYLLRRNTAKYKDIMQKLSQECIDILGQPPCKFALVGLGSLAREEVTLYSDFEHVVLLEDEADKRKHNSEEIREYFRWYTVIFHVLVIGIGETFIPTVGVKSLNDLYSGDKTKDWFFDLHTPGGVSFDGRFPHSCKTPLGKQEPSVVRKHVVELIQPVQKMLAFLSKDEDVKNGYHLRDVLMRTCFVHGNEEVYEQFHEKSCAQLVGESRDADVLIQCNLFTATMDHTLQHASDEDGIALQQVVYNFKRSFYRPISILVACLCRIHHKFDGSNFDIFELFRELYPKIDLQDLEYTLAVACEVRLKLYSALEHQRQQTSPVYLSKFVDVNCIIQTYRTLIATGIVFRRMIKRKIGYEGVGEYLDLIGHVSSELDIDLGIFKLFGFEGIPDKKMDSMESITFLLHAAHNDPRNQEKYFQKIEKILVENEQDSNRTLEYHRVKGLLCFHRSQYREALELMDTWTKMYLEGGPIPAGKQRFMQMQHLKSVSCIKCLPPQQALNYAKKELEEMEDVTTQIFFRITIFGVKMLMGEIAEARKSLQDASKICGSRDTAKAMLPDVHLAAAKIIFDLQMKNGWPEDAYNMFDLLQMLRSTVRQDKSFSSASSHSSVTNQVNTAELSTKWAEMRFLREKSVNDADHEQILILLLRKRGILKFPEVSNYFRKASPQILRNPAIFFGLNHTIMVYCKYIRDMSIMQVGEDMMSAFRTFPEHFKSPFYLGTLRCLSIHVAKISVDLKYHVEAVQSILFRAGRDEMTSMYNLAVKHLTHLNFKQAANFLWKVINSVEGYSALKRDSNRLLVHMTVLAPLVELLHFLSGHRTSFVQRHSFPEKDETRALYNEGLQNYARFRFARSAFSFWEVIHSSNWGSALRQRAIEMLMFVVLDVWKCNGYPMLIGEKYVFNQWTRSTNSNHVKYEYEDLSPALLMNGDNTLNMLKMTNVGGDLPNMSVPR